MSSTDELRRMLDELGVEYEAHDNKRYALTLWGNASFSEPLFANHGMFGAQCELMITPATPARSIAATMPERTCRNVIGEMDFACSECGAFVHARNANVGKSYVDEDGVRWYGTSYEHNFNYCPNCGARIEVVE